MNRFRAFAYKVSKNHMRTCWVLKCDIRKFFASIDQEVLLNIIRGYIPDDRVVALIAEVVGSFRTKVQETSTRGYPLINAMALNSGYGNGLPLGNLTSQLLINVYMNEFDWFVKHTLSAGGGSSFGGKAKYYIRYADDFVVLSHEISELVWLLSQIRTFLRERLELELHLNKVSIETFASGVDFLGWVHFPDHRVLRTSMKRRMFRNLCGGASDARVESYLGMLSHGNARTLAAKIGRSPNTA